MSNTQQDANLTFLQSKGFDTSFLYRKPCIGFAQLMVIIKCKVSRLEMTLIRWLARCADQC